MEYKLSGTYSGRERTYGIGAGKRYDVGRHEASGYLALNKVSLPSLQARAYSSGMNLYTRLLQEMRAPPKGEYHKAKEPPKLIPIKGEI